LPSSKLPPGTSIIQVFDRPDIAGRLLILGAPGAGKTTSLWVLASELIIRAANDVNKPIPVLFNLSSWADHRQGISEWLETELKSIYGVSVDVSQQWLANDQLLPLLDGLDELQSMDQEQCIEEINRFLRSSDQPSYLVVCCDLDEYERYSTKLELKGAVCLQPLTDEQIHDYLIKENCTDLWYYLEGDTEVMEFVKSPYMMSLMNLVYGKYHLRNGNN
jgi:predicted NACHT family NTPase